MDHRRDRGDGARGRRRAARAGNRLVRAWCAGPGTSSPGPPRGGRSHSMNRKFKGRRAPRGMTLIEIMVVLVILGLIASAVVIAVFPQLQRARVDRTTLDIGNIDSALKLYNARKGKFPDTATGLKALVDMEIIDKMPKDAWGNDYVYTPVSYTHLTLPTSDLV